MDKFEIRRQRLRQLRDERFNGKASALANEIGVDPSYVSRMLYPEDKKGRKRIGEEMVETIESKLKLPTGWMDDLVSNTNIPMSYNEGIEFSGSIKNGIVEVIGEAVLGVDGSIEMMEQLSGWLRIYSDDPKAFAVKVRGDSMFPRINSGEFVVVEPSRTIYAGDEVFIRTSSGHNMIKKIGYDRDGYYQFVSVNQSHAPITMRHTDVSQISYVAAIVKSSRYIDASELPQ
ncbi:helix-turn-helix transcriptional regulator [Hafnia alvei]|uniref:S24 family peptidase n=1 Tax=Hafnia alvei TaxID=569 RepID=UPI001F2F1A4A|nr:helix-turn-helix transcriptional regulator [Hafnia alvei]MCE9874249.1 helix-turn-helix transcriptional regulator [Hafnia alvei]